MEKFKTITKKIINNTIFQLVFLFIVIFGLFYATRNVVYGIKIVGIVSITVLVSFFLYLLINKKLDREKIILFILLFGIIIRIVYGLNNPINSHQHDVGSATGTGHYGYTLYIFRNHKLVDANNSQFYQPPLNSIIQAIWMHINTLFIRPDESIIELYNNMFNGTLAFESNSELIAYIDKLYATNLILETYYSIITLFAIYWILKQFKISDYIIYLVLGFSAIQPVMVMMSGTLNNDNISFMFLFLAILFAIKWFNKQTFINIIMIAIFIGLGMISKFSIGFIALLIGPMMIIKLIQRIKEKSFVIILVQLAVFAIIVFPLGLSYAIRNYIKFGQELTYILDFGESSWLRDEIREKNFYQRFIAFPIKDLIDETRGVFHNYTEYNIWIDLLKTSTYEEFSYSSGSYVFAGSMLFINMMLYHISAFSFVYLVIQLIRKKICDNLGYVLISIVLAVLALSTYISLNIKMPYSCTSNFRYIAYLGFANISLIALCFDKINNKLLKFISSVIVGFFGIFTAIFIFII